MHATARFVDDVKALNPILFFEVEFFRPDANQVIPLKPMIRLLRQYISGIYAFVFIVDALSFFASFYAGTMLRQWPEFGDLADFDPSRQLPLPSAVFTLIMLASSAGMGLYQRVQSGGDAALLLKILGNFVVGTILMGLIFYTFPAVFVGRGVFGFALLVALLLTLSSRFLFLRFVDRTELRRRVLVLGAGYNANMIHDFEQRNRNPGFRVIGFVLMGDEPCRVPLSRIVDPQEPLSAFSLRYDIDEIVVAPDDRRGGMAVDEILDCKMSGIQVVDLLSFFEREAGLVRVDCLHPSWLVFSDGFRYTALHQVGKRLFDVVVSLVLLSLAWPIMLLTAVAIGLEGGGRKPVFYRQIRVGRGWKPFSLIKFRSMRADAEQGGAAQWAIKNDERITLVGRFIRKTRIDELPQVLNVLKGDMSFVGPRPERPEFVQKFADTIPYYSDRLRVKPGITGWAQLNYPYGSGYQGAIEKLQYDLYYVKNYSVFLDFLIMLQTMEVVFWGKGAR